MKNYLVIVKSLTLGALIYLSLAVFVGLGHAGIYDRAGFFIANLIFALGLNVLLFNWRDTGSAIKASQMVLIATMIICPFTLVSAATDNDYLLPGICLLYILVTSTQMIWILMHS